MPRLVVEKGPDKNKSIQISEKKPVIIGRETSATLKINDLIASRLHFKIESRSDGYYIVDLNSSNGTFVNDQRISERLLKIGDKIQIGETLFSFLPDIPAKEQWPIGQTIEGYKIIERVGRGGMGTVYKALQLSLNRVVALKLLSEEMVKDKNFIGLFVQEARAAAQLNHPNIVQVYDVGSSKDVHYFSMEFLPGGSLEDVIAKRKKLPPEEALDIILQAARGLEYAEKKGIVHRDIKPDNLMIGEDKVIKICDLGLARSLRRPFAEEQKNIFGTPHYVAPEQALGKPVDHRADIYSLGSTFYKFIAGVTPYTGSSIKEIISKKIKEDPLPLKQLEPDLSADFCNIIAKMMRRNPDERYKSVSDVVGLLKDIKNGSIPLYASSDLTMDEEPLKKSFINNTALPGILLILSGVSVFLIIWYFYLYIRPSFIGPKVPTDNLRISSAEEEQRANEDFRDAELYLKSMNTKDVTSYVETINRYEKILRRYPRTKLTHQVKTRINELNKQVGQLKESARQEYFEMKAEIEFKNILDEIKKEQDYLVEHSQVNEVSLFINKWLTKLTNFKANYDKTTSASKVEDEKKQLQSWEQRINYTKKKYEEVEKITNNALAENKINYAFNALIDFIKDEKYRGLLYDKVAENLLQNVTQRARTDFQVLRENVSVLIKQENFEAAYQLLNKKLEFYGVPEVEQELKDELMNVEKILKERRDAENQRMLEADQRSFYPTYIEALILITYYDDFTNAQALLNVIKVQTNYYKNRIKNTLYEISCEHNVISAIQNNAQNLIKGKKKLRNEKIEQIAKGGITTQGNKTISWNEITAAEFYDLVSKGWILSSKENLALGILCLKRGGMINEANDLFNEARSGNPNKEEIIIIDNYLNQLKEEQALRKNDAYCIFTHAKDCYDKQQYFNAQKSYNLIKLRFPDTELYKNNSNFIEDMLKKIGRILNEKNNQQAPPK